MFRLVGYCIIIGPILLLLTWIFLWNEKKKKKKFAVVKVLSFWGVLVFIIVLYAKCEWFGNFVDVHIFPDRTYAVKCFAEDEKKQKIKLPSNSRWRYRTPDDVYYTKSSEKEIIEFFKNEFRAMKEEGELKKFSYDEKAKVFTAWLTEQKIAIICVYKDNRFSISIKER